MEQRGGVEHLFMNPFIRSAQALRSWVSLAFQSQSTFSCITLLNNCMLSVKKESDIILGTGIQSRQWNRQKALISWIWLRIGWETGRSDTQEVQLSSLER
jgi:hypothetical protein